MLKQTVLLKMAGLDSVSISNFQALVFNVETPSQETALQLFNVLCEKHNPRDGDEKPDISFAARRENGSHFP